jgi:hypothetical protein
VLPLAGCDEAAVSQDNVDLEQVVNSEAVAACEVADPTPQRQATTPVVEMNPLGTASPKG